MTINIHRQCRSRRLHKLGASAALRRRGPQRLLLLAIAGATAACSPSPQSTQPSQGSPQQATTAGEGLQFQGTWNAAGTRHTIPLGGNRRGSTIELRGTMLLTGGERPGVGFRSDVIALVDSDTGLQGRSVWTDEHQDQVFSELKGEGTAARNRITGTIFGGTGRYAGVTGSYEFSWESVTDAGDGSIQGRAVDLRGRIRPGPAANGASTR